VFDGQAGVVVAGVPHTVTAGQIIQLPANVPHAVTADGPFKMLLIMLR